MIEMIPGMIRRLYEHKVIRYLFVGGTTFIIDFGLLILLHGKFGLRVSIATSISFWVAVTYNFLLNRYWTFNSTENKRLHKHLAAYGGLLAFNYLFTVLFVSFFSRYIPYTVAKALSVILQTSWTYQIYNRVIFTSPNPSIATSVE